MIKREIYVFLMVGIMTALVDFSIYITLIWTNIFDTDIAKATGFLSGSLFAYFANRIWTFGHALRTSGEIKRFIFLYISTLMVNILVNELVIRIMVESPAVINIAFIIATGLSASMNFIGMKFIVFKTQNKSKKA